jgi:acyl-CoA oxidase
MMSIRQIISTLLPKVYGQAISIAVRYSVFRRQFKNKQGQEIPIITYQTQQEKLIPRIAEYFAITVGGNMLRNICLENSQQVEKGDLSLIGETHACLCLGKAYYTEIVYDGMEICRKACGGHGFSHYSGLPNMLNEFSPNLTHEG